MTGGPATRIVAACSPGEVRVAAMRDGAMLDYAIWRPGRPDGVGDMLRGRAAARVPAMAGVFVALPGRPDGFLPDSDGGAALTEGMAIGVRVTRAAQGGKGPRLTATGVPAATPGPPALLARGPGAVERLAALHPDAAVLADDPALVAQLRPALGNRIQAGLVLDDALLGWMDALAGPDILLPGGARASIHPTPALVAIDVDAGAATSDRRAKPAAQMAANLAALPNIARHIRLRNLSGAILVDVAGMSVRRRPALAPAFIAALQDDPLRPRFLGFTALGLAEIMRPRVHPPLHELLQGSHAAGLLALRAVMQAAAAEPSAVFALRCAPAVAAALTDDPVALPDLARRTGRPLIVQPDPGLPVAAWTPAWTIERTARA